ncbi:MAG: hypothetical protein AAGA56_11630 [Myxococcota bacterium]
MTRSKRATPNLSKLVRTFTNSNDDWERGQIATELHTTGVWKESGATNLKTFARERLGVTGTQLLYLRRVVAVFNETTVRTYGVAALRDAALLDEDGRARVLEALEDGASKRDVEKLVADIKRGPGKVPAAEVADHVHVPYDALFERVLRVAGLDPSISHGVRAAWEQAVADAVREATTRAVKRMRRRKPK